MGNCNKKNNQIVDHDCEYTIRCPRNKNKSLKISTTELSHLKKIH